MKYFLRRNSTLSRRVPPPIQALNPIQLNLHTYLIGLSTNKIVKFLEKNSFFFFNNFSLNWLAVSTASVRICWKFVRINYYKIFYSLHYIEHFFSSDHDFHILEPWLYYFICDTIWPHFNTNLCTYYIARTPVYTVRTSNDPAQRSRVRSEEFTRLERFVCVGEYCKRRENVPRESRLTTITWSRSRRLR